MKSRLATLAVPVAAFFALPLAACPGGPSRKSPSASGLSEDTVTIEREAGAPLRLDLDGCWSGQIFSFFGVDLFHDPDVGKRLRVVEDPVEGTRVVLVGIVPEREWVVVDRKSCTTFDVHVEQQTNFTHDEIRYVRGALKVDCELPNGIGHLSAKATFNDCTYDRRAKRL